MAASGRRKNPAQWVLAEEDEFGGQQHHFAWSTTELDSSLSHWLMSRAKLGSASTRVRRSSAAAAVQISTVGSMIDRPSLSI